MQILSTKLNVPPLRARLVSRARLIEKLDQGLECGFVLVSAPAGYGKSTLLSVWLNQLDIPSVWLSLDENDNDLHRFLNYLLSACRQVDPSLALNIDALSTGIDQPDYENLLTQLINHLAGLSQPFCLVVDDYHVIHDQSVHQAMAFLLEHHPEPLHVVIATRSDPHLPLSRLRARGEMFELRIADLRFTTQEAAEFLNHTMGLRILPNEVDRITRRTEGWIAGLQMAALSMQDMNDTTSFINAFTGSHHYIFDYLLDEVLRKQTPEIQRFLLDTSILDQLSAPICDALLQVDGKAPHSRPSSAILGELEHTNLFITPLDHEQRYYHYHPLFAELLRGYLLKNDPQLFGDLHALASTWYEDHGMISDAIHHAFAVRDWERSVRLISASIFALLEQNELTSVTRQMEILTGENSFARPWLLIAHAWLHAYTGQLSDVEPTLKQVEVEIDSLKNEEELQTLGGHIAAIRAYSNWIADKRELAASAAQVAIEWLPPDERLIRCQASTLLGLTLPDFADRQRALEQALDYARQCRTSHVTIFAHGCWAWLLAMQGKLREAYTAGQVAVKLAQSSGTYTSLPTLSHVYTTMSAVLLEWMQLDEALYYSRQAVDLARRWEQADALHFALDNYGYALFASGDVEGAFDVLQQAWQVAHRTSNWFEQITLTQEIEWDLSLNKVDAAVERLHQANVDLEEPGLITISSFKSILLPFTFVQIYLAQKQYSKALKLSTMLLSEVDRRQMGHYQIRLHIWQALAYNGLKQEEAALSSIKHALTLAAPEGYLHVFLIGGGELLPLLHKSRRAGVTPKYTAGLIECLEHNCPAPTARSAAIPGLIEELSAREMEVLKLLAQGCSDKKIAEVLVIAPETVHKHLKNIYGKLDVHSRTEAIRRSGELGLL